MSPELTTAQIAATRQSLQMIAEHLMSADLHRHTGRIGLRQTPGGLGTPTFIVDGMTRQLRVTNAGLIVRHGDDRTTHAVTSLGRLADDAAITPGAPTEVYSPTTECDLDAPLVFDPAAVDHLARFLQIGAEALARFATIHSDEEPTAAQLWPEHFDLAIAMNEVNYGACLGDAALELPYFYVAPWAAPTGEFWTETWGAALTWDTTATADDALAYYDLGRATAYPSA